MQPLLNLLAGVILSGTAGPGAPFGLGRFVSDAVTLFRGERHRSKLITALAFGSYNKRIPDAKSAYDWLSRDTEIVRKYLDDPACGFTFTTAGYGDLFSLLTYVNSDEWYKDIPKDIPILVVSGGEDPVGEYGRGPSEVAGKLEEAGCGDVALLIQKNLKKIILN